MSAAWRSRSLIFVVALVGAAVIPLTATPAYASSIQVTTTDDELNSDGDCSLREAVEAANTNASVDACAAGVPAPAVDVISFSVTGTITLGSTLPPISEAVMIDGPGAASLTISGGDPNLYVYNVGVMEVSAEGALDLEGVTVSDGYRTGGAGGIENYGTLTITNATFANDLRAGGGGGAIRNQSGGSVSISSSVFSSNGGAIQNAGMLAVSNTVFAGNYGGVGAAIDNYNGTVTVTGTSFTNNSTPNYGGAIRNNYGSFAVTRSSFSGNGASQDSGAIRNEPNGVFAVANSTFSGNYAGTSGGAILNLYGVLTVSNSTFSGNTAVTTGGAIHQQGSYGMLTVAHSTFSENSAGTYGGAIYQRDSVPVTLQNSIVSGSISGGNCSGLIVDGGGNLQYPGADCGSTIVSSDPFLDPAGLHDNGGPTQTIALQSGSPAIDTAVTANCPATDQRGVTRPQGAGCDIGAFELEQLRYLWTGFFQPVDTGIWNSAKAGAAIPVKFDLNGNQGLDVLKAGYPAVTQTTCPGAAVASDAIEQYVTASGGSTLTYDSVAHQYVYVWKTQKAWAGKCFTFDLGLKDGSSHTFNVQFTK